MKSQDSEYYRRKADDARGPQKIGDLLPDLLARRGYAQIAVHEECQQAWSRAVGELDQVSRAIDVKRGVLQVVVSNSVVMQELTFRKSDLISTLAKALPKHKINDLRFRVGKIS